MKILGIINHHNLLFILLSFVYFGDFLLEKYISSNQYLLIYHDYLSYNHILFVGFSIFIFYFIQLIFDSNPLFNHNRVSHKKNSTNKNFFKFVLYGSIFFCFVISYVMFTYRVGITIFVNFEPLPFKLAGIMFYLRLFVIPIVILVSLYRSDSSSILLLFLLIILAFFNTFVSGSRFISIVYFLPILSLLYCRKSSFISLIILYLLIAVSFYSRYNVLPLYIGSEEIISVYYREQYTFFDALMQPLEYIYSRLIGLNEFIAAVEYNYYPMDFIDSISNFISTLSGANNYITNLEREVLGVPPMSTGGYSLGLFGFLFSISNSNPLVYFLFILFVSLTFSFTFNNLKKILIVFRVYSHFIFNIVYILLFMLLIENRHSVIMYLLFFTSVFLFLKSLLYNAHHSHTTTNF